MGPLNITAHYLEGIIQTKKTRINADKLYDKTIGSDLVWLYFFTTATF